MKRTLFKTIIGLTLLLPLMPKAQQSITSQFSLSLADSTLLKLSPQQVKRLQQSQKKLADSIGLVQAYPDSIQFNRPAFESRTMESILTNKQYNQILNKKNKPIADAEAQAKWDAIVAKHEDDLFIKDSLLPKLAAKILAAKNINDRYSHKKNTADSATKAINAHQPEALWALAASNAFLGTVPNAKITKVLKDRATYGLSQKQVQQLLAADRHLKRRMDSVRRNQDTAFFSWVQLDNNSVQRILTPAQFNQFTQVLYQNKTSKIAVDKWTNAVAKNATGNYNQQIAVQQLANYYMQYNTLQDLYAGNRKAKDSALNALNRQMPDSFQVLLSGNRLWEIDTAGLIGIALKNQQNLGLRNSLIDSLALHARWEKRQGKLAMKYRDSLKFSRTAYEYTLLPKLLTDSQYTKLLTLRYQPEALKGAKKCWKDLSDLGLSASYNQDSTISAIAAYYLEHSNIEAKNAVDEPTKKRKIRQLDLTMPTALAVLRHAKKSNASKPSSGLYVW